MENNILFDNISEYNNYLQIIISNLKTKLSTVRRGDSGQFLKYFVNNFLALKISAWSIVPICRSRRDLSIAVYQKIEINE